MVRSYVPYATIPQMPMSISYIFCELRDNDEQQPAQLWRDDGLSVVHSQRDVGNLGDGRLGGEVEQAGDERDGQHRRAHDEGGTRKELCERQN